VKIEYISARLNVCYLLADIIEGTIMDVERDLKKIDETIELPIRHSAERIKIHTKNMVSLVNKCDFDYAVNFGEVSDKLKLAIFKEMEIVKSKEDLDEDLCNYCTHKENRHLTNFSSGCEGLYCDDAYENYLEEIF